MRQAAMGAGAGIGRWPRGRAADRDVAIGLGLAMCAASALIVWLGRGATFSTDELNWFSAAPNLDLHTALDPYNGHLILLTRIVYAAMFHAFGTDYLPFRLLGLASVLVTAALFFVFAARRIGSVIALAPTLVLLVYGSDANHILLGNAFGDLTPLALGIGALLALERDDRPGDIAACVLLCLAVACFSVGLAFVGGAAALTLIEAKRRRRAWVFIVPAVLYGAWLLWSRHSTANTGENVQIWNLLLVPTWALDSLANIGQSFLGLNNPAFGSDWGPVAAVGALVALGMRLRRGFSSWLLATMAVPATLWLLEATAALPPIRAPDSARYLFPGTVCVLLVVVEAARGVRLKRTGITVLCVAGTFAVATNVSLLRAGAFGLRLDAITTRTDLAAIEIGGGRLGPQTPRTLFPETAPPGANVRAALRPADDGGIATGYLQAVRQFGSPAYSRAELARQPEGVREHADAVLASDLGPQLLPSASPLAGCRQVTAAAGQPTSVRLPPGGAVLKTTRATASVALRRFGSAFTLPAGTLFGGAAMALSIPADSAPNAWYASISAPSVSVCRIGAAAAP